eukprot:8241482-Pyramimonas_sp.AAC.1
MHSQRDGNMGRKGQAGRVRRAAALRGILGKYRSSVASPASLRTRVTVTNTRGVFKVCYTSDDQRRRHRGPKSELLTYNKGRPLVHKVCCTSDDRRSVVHRLNRGDALGPQP